MSQAAAFRGDSTQNPALFRRSPLHSLAFRLLRERVRWKIAILFLAISSTLLGLTGPFFQKAFVDNLSIGASAAATRENVWNLLNFFICFLSSISLQLLAQYIGQREAVHIQQDLGEKIYNQMLGLKADRLKNTQVGEIVSLYTIDAAGSGAWIELAWTMGVLTIFPLLLAPFMLQQLLHIPLTPIVITMACSLLLTSFLSWRQSRFFMAFKRLAAERTGLVNEWIQNIRALRSLHWMRAYESRMFQKRIQETDNRVAMVSNGQTMATMGASLGFVLNFVGIYALSKSRPEGALSAGELTATIWALGVFLARFLRGIPWILTFAMDSLTSIRRVEAFLNLRSDNIFVKDKQAPPEKDLLNIKNLCLEIDHKTLLKNISLQIAKPQLIAIVGSVGSGKTLFIQSLLGEVEAHFESFSLLGKNVAQMNGEQLKAHFSLVPQDGFTASTSIRNNILLDYDTAPADADKTNQAIADSLSLVQFSLEGEGFSDGTETLLGERGINLSGGQRQRLGLARALVANRPFLILDDSLSAVDVNTERAMIETLFKQRWNDRVIFFVTHRHLTLPLCDRVLFFKNGELKADGRYDELEQSHEEFQEFIRETEKLEKGAPHELLS